jgi:hypothetical protein
MDWLELFCHVDDFCQQFEPLWEQRQLEGPRRRRRRSRGLTNSEIMTILIAFHSSHYRNFKHFYLMLTKQHRADFPGLVSYHRFVEWMPSVFGYLCAYLQQRMGACTGISFIDSTSIIACGNKRISKHRTLQAVAQRGKTTMGWFYGTKLHLVINEQGELLGVRLTPGNVDDRQPAPELADGLWGKLFGDKGYISSDLFAQLWEQGLHLVTGIRSNMKNKLLPLIDKILLRKRSIIETVNDQLKNIAQIEHTRHRSLMNFFVNLVSGLISYTHQPKKPAIKLSPQERNLLGLFQVTAMA